jgi:hypothetical protein
MRVRVSLASRRRRKERRARLGEFGVIEFYLKLPKKIKIKSSRKEKLCIELTRLPVTAGWRLTSHD